MFPENRYWQMHDDAALRRIDEAAMRLLTRSGCRIEHEGLLDAMRAAGCHVDAAAKLCRFTEKLIRDAVRHLGGSAKATADLPGAWNPQRHLYLSGSYPHFLDWPSGQRRLATKEDTANMAKMGHVLEEFRTVGRVLVCCEVDPLLEPLWTTLALAEITDKPICGGEVFYAKQAEWLVRMGEVITGRAGETNLVASCDFFISPLVFDQNQAACFLTKRRFGMTNVPGTMPISGMSAPVTLAGTVAVAVAELLAGWVFGYVVSPDVAAGGIVASGSLDMRTASACFGSPEALLQDMTTVQVCRRLYGIPVSAATDYVDCKRPGLEAVFQKMFPLVSSPFGTGLRAGATGLLSAGQDYSPVQHLLEADMAGAIERFQAGFEVSDETLAVELTEEVIASAQTNFLDTDHTLTRFRSEQWYPKWMDRKLWQNTAYEIQAEREMLERVDRYWKDAVARYEPPALDRAKIGELRRIYRAAEREAH